MYPLKFEPVLKQAIWGGEKIIPFRKIEARIPCIGESWEVSAIPGSESVVANGPEKGSTLTRLVRLYKAELVGESNYNRFGDTFPLLVKFLDAKQDLSIQVHPSDALAGKRHSCMGKTEMWYIIDADPDAEVGVGFSQEISRREYEERALNGTITEVIRKYKPGAGDVFFLPAGRIHWIGAGTFIAEIEQTSDITYRIYDFNRTNEEGQARQLHIDQAKEALDYEVQADYRTHYEPVKNKPVELEANPYFTTSLYEMTEEISCDYSELDSFVIFICVAGTCTMKDNEGNEITLVMGETVLFPAVTQQITIIPEGGGVKLLETYV